MVGIDAAIANAFRRILLSEVGTALLCFVNQDVLKKKQKKKNKKKKQTKKKQLLCPDMTEKLLTGTLNLKTNKKQK